MSGEQSLLVYHIDPLPDFLLDHTLSSQNRENILNHCLSDHLDRWIQFINCLWTWHDQAVFFIRYISANNKIHAFLGVYCKDRSVLQHVHTSFEALICLNRLLVPGNDLRPSVKLFLSASSFTNPVISNWSQYVSDSVWRPNLNLESKYGNQLDVKLSKEQWDRPRVVLPWQGPGGSFLLPMEVLVRQSSKVMMTIYLAPTRLTKVENQWLTLLARSGQTQAQRTYTLPGRKEPVQSVDPAAQMVGEISLKHQKRLSVAPFQVFFQCVSESSDTAAVHTIEAAMMASVQETAYDDQTNRAIHSPTGISRCSIACDFSVETIAKDMMNNRINGESSLDRLSLLSDAKGAATVFRFPVNMRGGVPGMRVRQLSPDFHPGPRQSTPPDHTPSISLGGFEGGGQAFISVRELKRHALIVGTTGSGKTVTVLQIIHQLWADHEIPFLVIESAKQEYRGLLSSKGIKDGKRPLHVYTLGNENCAPFRLNPFELLPSVRVEAHISKLQTCIESTIPPIGPSSSIISEALHTVYENHGWELWETVSDEVNHRKPFPKLSDFTKQIETLISGRGYKGEVRDNLQAALLGRLKPLLLGSKGAMFNTEICFPSADQLFNNPVILELNDLNPDEKALATVFILSLLREHCEAQRRNNQELAHVTIVEEAHNVLSQVSSVGASDTRADTRFKAVEAFCSLLSEIRAFGEGIVISDQSPQKLARDAIRNSNILIAHNLRDAYDRQTIADSSIMDEMQHNYLGKLKQGQAAMFLSGLEKATFVSVNPFGGGDANYSAEEIRGVGYSPELNDSEVRDHMVTHKLVALPFGGCKSCEHQCQYRSMILRLISTPQSRESAHRCFDLIAPDCPKGRPPDMDHFYTTACRNAINASRALPPSINLDKDFIWCHFLHAHGYAVNNTEWAAKQLPILAHHHREMLLEAFKKIISGFESKNKSSSHCSI